MVALRKQGKALYTLIQFNAYIHTEVIRSPGAAALKGLDLKPKRTQTARMYVGAWESFVPSPEATYGWDGGPGACSPASGL